jgi:ABC-2 type transport system ATP-binding protein
MDGRIGNAVELVGLYRVFQSGRHEHRTVLNGLDLTVRRGEVHGLLGPNGSGKTTLCKILATLLLPTGGTAFVEGHDVVRSADQVRRAVGLVLGGERGLYSRLTARQNLVFWAALYGLPTKLAGERAAMLLRRLGLADRADDRVESFSRGMKQRVHLARGLISDPRVVVMDEPTVGLDPVAAHEFRRLVGELRADGRTILITTHDMAEAQAVCDRVSFIDDGNLLMTVDPRDITEWAAGH